MSYNLPQKLPEARHLSLLSVAPSDLPDAVHRCFSLSEEQVLLPN